MKKFTKILMLPVTLLVCCLVLVACGVQTSAIKITFMVDGQVYHIAEAKSDGSITFPQDPSKPDLYFAGWYADGEAEFSFDETVTASIKLHAKFSDQYIGAMVDCKVYFDSFGGSAVQPMNIKSGLVLNYPSNPVKRGFEFGGWFTDRSYFYAFNPYNIAGQVFLDDEITVYAKWNLVEYKITYDLDGGTNPGNPASYNVSSVFSLKNPVRAGYVFTGWTFASVTTPQINFTIRNSIGDLSFKANWTSVQGLSFTLIKGNTEYSVAKGTYDAADVFIPAIYNGLPVTEIGERAFRDSNITSVVIPSTVTVIDRYAFYNCAGLTSVTIPSGVTTINDYAFAYCTGMTNVTLPNTVKTLGRYAFHQTNSLTSINIPDSVTSMGDFAFYNSGITSAEISNSLTSISEYAFAYCGNLTSVIIPEGVTLLGRYAFHQCVNLQKVVIPSSVKSIGDYAFFNNVSLAQVFYGGATASQWNAITIGTNNTLLKNAERYYFSETMPVPGNFWRFVESVPTVWAQFASQGLAFTLIDNGTAYAVSGGTANDENVVIPARYNGLPVTEIAEHGFYGWWDLKTILIPDGVTVIGGWAFKSSNLTEVVIPNTVTYIGFSAFSCYYLTSITIPSSVVYIVETAFAECANLASITVDSNNPVYRSEGNCLIRIADSVLISGCKNSIIPYGVTYIGEWAFYYCYDLPSITIPDSVTVVGWLSFNGCISLTSIVFPSSVTSIGDTTLYGCFNLESIVVASGNPVYRSEGNCLIRIADNVLTIGCKNSVIPFGVTAIGNTAFEGRFGLTSIKIPSSVTTIGYFAFFSCADLKSIQISSSVTEISDYAFVFCYGLPSITISSSVSIMGNSVFAGTELTVYTELADQPNSWHENWNQVDYYGSRPVFWGCTLSQDKTYVVSFTKTLASIENPDNYLTSAPIREGFVFGGWATTAGGTVAAFTAENVSNASNGTTLYAIWVPIN